MTDHRNGADGAHRPASSDRQVIEANDFDRLLRAQFALQLLAAVNTNVATEARISHDATAAIAEYIRDDMQLILGAAMPEDEAR